jgi:hypothetical protein
VVTAEVAPGSEADVAEPLVSLPLLGGVVVVPPVGGVVVVPPVGGA